MSPCAAVTTSRSSDLVSSTAVSPPSVRVRLVSNRRITSSGSSDELWSAIAARSVSATSRCRRAVCTATSSWAARAVSSDTAMWLVMACRMSTSSRVKTPFAMRLSR